jgi:hypothetical protein
MYLFWRPRRSAMHNTWPKRVDKMIGILGYQTENIWEEKQFVDDCYSENWGNVSRTPCIWCGRSKRRFRPSFFANQPSSETAQLLLAVHWMTKWCDSCYLTERYAGPALSRSYGPISYKLVRIASPQANRRLILWSFQYRNVRENCFRVLAGPENCQYFSKIYFTAWKNSIRPKMQYTSSHLIGWFMTWYNARKISRVLTFSKFSQTQCLEN